MTIQRIKKILTTGLLVLGLSLGAAANAMVHYTKQWTVASIFGSFANSKYRYYIEPQLRLIDDRYVFNQSLFLVGLGYQLTPDIMVFTGPGWITTKDPQGVTYHDFRIWQQMTWTVYHTDLLSLNSRTRLEETTRSNAPQMALQFRQRLWVRIPIKYWNGHTLSMFDEVFFNLNHPKWASPKFFSQNRAFIGIGTQLSKSVMFDVGYLNQYIMSTRYQQNNVLLLSFTVNC